MHVPIYDFVSHQRSEETRYVQPADVVILEGIMVLHMPEVREMLNMKVTWGRLPIAESPGALLHTSLSPTTGANAHACHTGVCRH